MAKYSELLRQEAEEQEAKVRAIIGHLDADGLAEWCRAEIYRREEFFDPDKWSLDRLEVIANTITTEDEEAALELARKYHKWRDDLKTLVRLCRMRKIAIPDSWIKFLQDDASGIEPKPDERGLGGNAIRDEAICRCIQYIGNCTKYKVSRTGGSEKDCGISIVAKALGMRYFTVETVWKRYRKRMKQDELL